MKKFVAISIFLFLSVFQLIAGLRMHLNYVHTDYFNQDQYCGPFLFIMGLTGILLVIGLQIQSYLAKK